jgi:deoxynucleotidyltransferase terminal-interacting protein 1
MGAKANKALGLGATRGRLYIKHPDVFKYSGDQDDKQWLHERHLMPATGGRTYLLIEEDIKDLARTDEYRNNPGLMLDELVGFPVPAWMLDKMKAQMKAQRTDAYKLGARSQADSASPSRGFQTNADYQEPEEEGDEADYSSAGKPELPLNSTGGFLPDLKQAGKSTGSAQTASSPSDPRFIPLEEDEEEEGYNDDGGSPNSGSFYLN